MPLFPGRPAPNLSVSEWVQGEPTNLDQHRGSVVLLEVFQVNCPGCFFTAIPEAIKVHDHFAGEPVTVLGLATAFEDWDKNTLDNLRRLAETGEVIGETRRMLEQARMLDDGRLRYRIPFPLAMDELVPVSGEPTRDQALAAIRPQVPQFDVLPPDQQSQLIERVSAYLATRQYAPKTFDTYALHGTPSAILIDRNGKVRETTFGQTGDLAPKIQILLDE
ncbi:MAG: TlpA family protein disulfide reductase [Acidobacteria bacterium]|nr:TlpA family protein disulfide reductase [Acidobacteriota bacterium]